MAYLKGLLYTAERGNEMQETRLGVPLYSGTAHDLEEWKFKVLLKAEAVKKIKNEDDRVAKLADLSARVMDGLSGEPLRIAMDHGVRQISDATGIEDLVKAVSDHVIQFKEDEARELFRAGTKVDGLLARQSGESMASYINRRTRWFRRMQTIDPATKVSDNILADYLLEGAGISHDQQLMVRTACDNETTFSGFSAALRRHHSKIHLRESRREGPIGRTGPTDRKPFQRYPASSGGRWGSKPSFGNGRGGRGFRRTGFVADETYGDEQDYDDEPEDAAYAANDQDNESEPEDDGSSWTCFTAAEGEQTLTVEERIEHDVVACFLAAGANMEDDAACKMCGEAVQDELMAFYSREQASRHGVPTRRHIHSYKPKSELSIEERKKSVAKAKEKSTCRGCGKEGHWAGDPECPLRGSTGGQKGAGKHGGQRRHDQNKPKQFKPMHRGRPVGMLAVMPGNQNEMI